MDQMACNYDPEATADDGNCDMTSCYGCMDPDADNYDPNATFPCVDCCVTSVEQCFDKVPFKLNRMMCKAYSCI